jgi:hypothetical protein
MVQIDCGNSHAENASGLRPTQQIATHFPTHKRSRGNTRLHRRLEQIDQLGAKEKRQVMQFLDTILDREKLQQKVSG